MMNRKLYGMVCLLCASLAAVDAQAQTRILPLGDSVTSSFAPYSSYRYWLWHSLIDRGYDVDFVGTQYGVEGGTPEKTDYDQDHEGHPGWTSQDVLANIDTIAAATQPDVVLLDAMGNDVADEIPREITIANLEGIIESLRAVNPAVTILLAQPTPFAGQDRRAMAKVRSAIRKVAKQQTMPGSPVIAVNLFGGFNVRKDTSDGVHPDESGEQKIAKRYFRVLSRILP